MNHPPTANYSAIALSWTPKRPKSWSKVIRGLKAQQFVSKPLLMCINPPQGVGPKPRPHTFAPEPKFFSSWNSWTMRKYEGACVTRHCNALCCPAPWDKPKAGQRDMCALEWAHCTIITPLLGGTFGQCANMKVRVSRDTAMCCVALHHGTNLKPGNETRVPWSGLIAP